MSRLQSRVIEAARSSGSQGGVGSRVGHPGGGEGAEVS